MSEENRSSDSITKNSKIIKDISIIEQNYTNSYINNNNENVQNNYNGNNEKHENSSSEKMDSKEAQSDFFNKKETMEFLIDIIKKNSYNKIKNEIKIKLNQKSELENNIKYYYEKINIIRAQKRNFNYFKKIMNNEINRIDNSKKIICKPKNDCKNDLIKIKKEINSILNQIKAAKENLEENNSEISEIRNEILKFKEMIKKLNMTLRKQKIENENKQNTINLLNKHILLIKEKINKENDQTKGFFFALTNLAIKSKIHGDLNKSENQKNKRPQSFNGYKKIPKDIYFDKELIDI